MTFSSTSIIYILCSSLQTNTDTFTNWVDPDETAHNESSNLDLLYFAFLFLILDWNPDS